MSVAKKYLLNGSIVVTVIDSTDILHEAARLHGLGALPAAVLNRVLTVGVFMGRDLKNEEDKLSVIVSGASEDGSGGESVKIAVAAKMDSVKGYVEEGRLLINGEAKKYCEKTDNYEKTDGEADCGNGGKKISENKINSENETDSENTINAEYKTNGETECNAAKEINSEQKINYEDETTAATAFKNAADSAAGGEGYITVIKDSGMKEPYTGRSELVKGDLSSDFALYFTVSEQKPSAVVLGEYFNGKKILAAGGFFVQVLPGADDFLITIVQDILRDFGDFGKMLRELKTPDAIMDTYFADFDVKKIDEFTPRYFCGCGGERTRNIIRMLGRAEAYEILKNVGMIEARCDFCGKIYRYGAKEVKEIFEQK
ncbi:MAG: Hsp33 family molecular chaperone HslO [Clostridiales bacterium]|nr:Hsp33 family molecular chaperone HslO [Clostridiales bacterium]